MRQAIPWVLVVFLSACEQGTAPSSLSVPTPIPPAEKLLPPSELDDQMETAELTAPATAKVVSEVDAIRGDLTGDGIIDFREWN